ncbi:uncharacterized protein LOC121370840 [Gigantopelta aegis]|uniref:uncharacterized protein LOC121370840 n=1 Tax=Gigantopelta aegis TaxID=1735272 RepID=UPI001B88E03A|nr:uncharacterized protein LOC121370840 [Gigantopelta aegis]
MDKHSLNTCSLSRLYRWKALYESPLLGPDFVLRRQQGRYVEAVLRPNSIVYAKKGYHLPQLSHKRPLIIDERDIRDDVTAILRNYSGQTSMRSRLLELDEKQKPVVYKWEKVNILPSVRPQQQQVSSSLSSLLRKPLVRSDKCVVKNQDVTKMASVYKGFELDLSGAKTRKYYEDHFPLLANIATHSQLKPPSRRDLAIEIQNNYVLKKQRDVRNRLVRLSSDINNLERQESEGLVTTLRNEEFDPRSWPWNTDIYP